MSDEEDIAAEHRAYGRRFPFMLVGALALLLGLGFITAALQYWPP